MKSSRRVFFCVTQVLILFLWTGRVLGQCPASLDLPDNYLVGEATLTLSGCIPLNVAIRNDVPGAVNTRTLFDYQGGAIPNLNPTTENVYIYQKPGTYTLVQLSETPGKKWVTCRTVEVLDTLAPVVRAIPCADGGVQLNFEDSQPTSYPTYQIDWGDTEIKGYTGYGTKINYRYDSASTYTIRVRGVHTPGQCRGTIRQITFVVPKAMNPPSILEARATDETQFAVTIENPLKADLLLQKGTADGVFDNTGGLVGRDQLSFTTFSEPPELVCFRLEPADSCLASLRSPPLCVAEFDLLGRSDVNTLSWKIPANPPGLTAAVYKDGTLWKDITALGTDASISDREFVCGNETCYQLVVNYEGSTFYSLEKCHQVPVDECVARPPFYIPDAFSPNGDGINDRLEVKGVFSTDYELSVFDTWGIAVFNTSDPQGTWDGTYAGREAPGGTYAYSVRYRHVDGVYYTSRGLIVLLR